MAKNSGNTRTNASKAAPISRFNISGTTSYVSDYDRKEQNTKAFRNIVDSLEMPASNEAQTIKLDDNYSIEIRNNFKSNDSGNNLIEANLLYKGREVVNDNTERAHVGFWYGKAEVDWRKDTSAEDAFDSLIRKLKRTDNSIYYNYYKGE